MNRETREKRETGKVYYFHGVTKMVLKFKPIEFDGFRLVQGFEFDPFENEHQNELADFDYGESATITGTVQP